MYRISRKRESFKKEQQELKAKHHIDGDEERIVVEKNNMVKFTIRTVSGVVRVIASILICTLAVIGLASIVYPEPREDMAAIARDIYKQLQQYLPMLLN